MQRTILRTMQAAPDQAFTAKQLCDVVYRVTVKRHRRVAVLRAGIQLAERAMVDSAMLYVRYLRNWRGRDRGMVFFNAANFVSGRQAKEIVGFGYSDSAVAPICIEPDMGAPIRLSDKTSGVRSRKAMSRNLRGRACR